MTIDEIKLTAEEGIELEQLIDNFKKRNHTSPAKKAHQANEIKVYSLIFDEVNLPLPVVLQKDDNPLKGYKAPELCSMQIWLIREFWMHFIVEVNDIAEIDNFEPDSWYWNLNDFASDWLTNPRHYYSLAVIYCKYLDWLHKFQSEGMTNAELALLKVYEGEILIGDGSKLYQLWAKYRKKVNRTGTENSQIKNRNKIELFEQVISRLSGESKIRAIEDLNTLKINIDNHGFDL